MRTVNLSYNSINGLDIEPLAKLIDETSSINELNLGFNDIGNKGAGMILHSLRNNKSLFSMNLAGNKVSETLTTDIDNCLRANSKLKGTIADIEGYTIKDTLEIRRGLGIGRRPNGAIDEDYQTGDSRRVVNFDTNGIAFAETVLNEERRRGMETREVMAGQIDELMKKDLQGAQIIKELESK